MSNQVFHSGQPDNTNTLACPFADRINGVPLYNVCFSTNS